MNEDFVMYHKFTDYDTLKDFSDELAKNGIEYELYDNNQSYVKVFGYTQIDIPYGINIRQNDFLRADGILEKYYENQIKDIDRSYYLFSFSNDELLEIIAKSYDWGLLDFALAKHLLKERGININEQEIQSSKKIQLDNEKIILKASKIKIIIGYILSLILPMIAVFIGISIYYNRRLLRNGERFYVHPESDRKHGKNIIIISVLWFVVFFIVLFTTRD